jgi:hypothetical protein
VGDVDAGDGTISTTLEEIGKLSDMTSSFQVQDVVMAEPFCRT